MAEPERSEVVEAGIIQAFEFTFEQCWKLMQVRAHAVGLAANSPKASMACGLKLGLIDDEQCWLDMLRDRNLTSHTYHRQLAQEIVGRIESRYVEQFALIAERTH